MNPELINADVFALLEDYAPNSWFTEDHEGKPFFIVEGWSELGGIQRALNEVHAAELFAQYKPLYDKRNAECKYDWEKSGGRPYQSLAIHHIRPQEYLPVGANALEIHDVEVYEVPEGLIELDSVCEWGFSDEYQACSSCCKIVETSPSYHGWQLRGYYSDDGLFCQECTRDDPELYFEEYKNKSKLVNEHVCSPENDGWIDLELSYENGLHSGQNDDPKSLLKLRERLLPFADFIFTGSIGQFDISFTVWVKPVEFAWEDRGGWVDLPEIFSEVCRRMIAKGYKTPAVGPSDYAKAALRSTPVAV